jgi:diguanylate cyclase (GGDEF)-like protein
VPINESVDSTQRLRDKVTEGLVGRCEPIVTDTVALFPYSGDAALDPEYSRQVGHTLALLLIAALRGGEVDARGLLIGDLHRLVLERSLAVDRLFTFAYLVERTALDELALSEEFGAASDVWPQVEQMTRRATFDVLASYSERAQKEPPGGGTPPLLDRLTTLYSRAMFDAVLENEVERGTRVGYPVSLILFDMDRLGQINQEHGYGVGDRILERVGILIRKYFRQQDWVARWAGGAFSVLITHTDGNDVATLAERVRSTVEQRLGFVDHRNDQPVVVTLSGAVLNVEIAVGDRLDTQFVRAEAERTLALAKTNGRNRVERTDRASSARS